MLLSVTIGTNRMGKFVRACWYSNPRRPPHPQHAARMENTKNAQYVCSVFKMLSMFSNLNDSLCESSDIVNQGLVTERRGAARGGAGPSGLKERTRRHGSFLFVDGEPGRLVICIHIELSASYCSRRRTRVYSRQQIKTHPDITAAHWQPTGSPLAALWQPTGSPLEAHWKPTGRALT